MAAFRDRDPREARWYRLSEHGPTFQLSHNVQLWELACKCGATSPPGFTYGGIRYADAVLVHPALVQVLQAARDFFGRPLHVNSGFRTEAHNASPSVGGEDDSLHTMGMAADVWIEGVDTEELASFFAHALGAGGVGLYPGRVHVSVGREGGSDRTWIAGRPAGETFANHFPGGVPGALPGTGTGVLDPGIDVAGLPPWLLPPRLVAPPALRLPDLGPITGGGGSGPLLAGMHPVAAALLIGAAVSVLASHLRSR